MPLFHYIDSLPQTRAAVACCDRPGGRRHALGGRMNIPEPRDPGGATWKAPNS